MKASLCRAICGQEIVEPNGPASALSLEDYRALADQSECGLLLVDEAARVQFVNRHLLESLGLAHRDLVGDRPCDLFAACWDGTAPFHVLPATLRGVTFEVQLVRADGTRRLCEVRRTPFRTSSGLEWQLLRVAPRTGRRADEAVAGVIDVPIATLCSTVQVLAERMDALAAVIQAAADGSARPRHEERRSELAKRRDD